MENAKEHPSKAALHALAIGDHRLTEETTKHIRAHLDEGCDDCNMLLTSYMPVQPQQPKDKPSEAPNEKPRKKFLGIF